MQFLDQRQCNVATSIEPRTARLFAGGDAKPKAIPERCDRLGSMSMVAENRVPRSEYGECISHCPSESGAIDGDLRRRGLCIMMNPVCEYSKQVSCGVIWMLSVRGIARNDGFRRWSRENSFVVERRKIDSPMKGFLLMKSTWLRKLLIYEMLQCTYLYHKARQNKEAEADKTFGREDEGLTGLRCALCTVAVKPVHGFGCNGVSKRGRSRLYYACYACEIE